MKLLSRITRRHVLITMIVVSVASMVLGRHAAEWFRHFVQPLFTPLGDAGMYLTVGMRTNVLAAGEGDWTAEDYEKLQRECDVMLASAQYWQAAAEKAQEQMDALLGFQKSYGPVKNITCELIPARVVGEASLAYEQQRALNVGHEDGADRGQWVLATNRSKAMPAGLAVVSSSALVGRVISAGAFSARMQLVTDRQFRARARIRRVVDPDHPREIRRTDDGQARVEVLSDQNNRPIDVEVVGDGGGGLIIRDVWRYDNVLPGDAVVTAEGVFCPLEVRIGRVHEVQADPKHPDRVILAVRPEIDVGTLRDVFIISSFVAGRN